MSVDFDYLEIARRVFTNAGVDSASAGRACAISAISAIRVPTPQPEIEAELSALIDVWQIDPVPEHEVGYARRYAELAVALGLACYADDDPDRDLGPAGWRAWATTFDNLPPITQEDEDWTASFLAPVRAIDTGPVLLPASSPPNAANATNATPAPVDQLDFWSRARADFSRTQALLDALEPVERPAPARPAVPASADEPDDEPDGAPYASRAPLQPFFILSWTKKRLAVTWYDDAGHRSLYPDPTEWATWLERRRGGEGILGRSWLTHNGAADSGPGADALSGRTIGDSSRCWPARGIPVTQPGLRPRKAGHP